MRTMLLAAALAATAMSPAFGAELVTNGDFSAGATGFDTTYTTDLSGLSQTVGAYTTTTNPRLLCAPCFPNIGDHTSGSGNMLFIDGASVNTGAFWSQTFSVVANSNYDLSLWATSLGFTGPSPALRVAINGTDVIPSTILPYSTGSTATTWQQFSTSWSSGSATSVTISLFNDTLIYAYNDLAVDDISFTGPAPSAVPEPAAWGLMIGGFGLAGAALRRRERVTIAAS